MSKRKKILLIGPISSSGGREVMTNLLINSLNDYFSVEVFSTILMTRKSVALKSFNGQWGSLSLEILKSNPMITLLAILSRARSKRKGSLSEFSLNTVSLKFFNFNRRSNDIIKKKLAYQDFIIFSGEINNDWFQFIACECDRLNIPLLLRLTGQVDHVPNYFKKAEFQLNILAHSIKNEQKLRTYKALNIWQVDQTTVLEKELLKLEIKCNKNLIFGFLGRFTEEKGIIELLNCFKERDDKLIIAGSGKYADFVQTTARQSDNLTFVGKLNQNKIAHFFSQIDVLIIPSFVEGGPIVGVEAMAAGKLIISTRVGAMEERLKSTNNDFWFEHRNHLGLHTCVDRILDMSKKRNIEIRKNVRERYLKRNQFEIIKNTYRTIVEEIFNSKESI